MMFGRKKKSRMIDAVTPNFSNFTEEELADMRRCFTGEIMEEEIERSSRALEEENEQYYWQIKNWVETKKWDDGSDIAPVSYNNLVKHYNEKIVIRKQNGKLV